MTNKSQEIKFQLPDQIARDAQQLLSFQASSCAALLSIPKPVEPLMHLKITVPNVSNVLDEWPSAPATLTMLSSMDVLQRVWGGSEEDEAWSDL